MNKRGTHVGLVLSFAVFVIFLVFLYSVIEPAIKIQKDKRSLLDYLERELIEQFNGNVETFTVIIEEEIHPNKDCINIPNILKDMVDEDNLIIKDDKDNILNYSVQGQSLLIKVGYNFSGFLKVYYAEELGRSPIFKGGGCHPITNVSLGIIRTYTEVFETKIYDLFERYENDYESLKEDLKIPAGTDFGFSFVLSNGTIISTQEETPLTSIYAREVPIQYIDNQGNIDFGYINIRVW